jgi:hypothetical protein
MPPKSAIPDIYYFCFGAYEPFLNIVGFLGTLADPTGTHNSQAPWLQGIPPPKTLPTATLVTVLQLGIICALLALINIFVLSAARHHLKEQPALQEKIIFSLLAPLLFSDVFHLAVTFWALGDQKWDFENWTPMLWITVISGLTLMVPRICWHLGIGRYVDLRDRSSRKTMSDKR